MLNDQSMVPDTGDTDGGAWVSKKDTLNTMVQKMRKFQTN